MTPQFNGSTDALDQKRISRVAAYRRHLAHWHFGYRHLSSIRRAS
ncbi:hypothetical protein JOF43_002760 [Brachybacterium sacelli]|uniref:Uncharacterized protein n=1 Tax=Brachybacterium sacelli TaxID=173364 RepID=A0ABS4X339_9MICO|nr:hypothetical protein [Brachybacterium sacelli]